MVRECSAALSLPENVVKDAFQKMMDGMHVLLHFPFLSFRLFYSYIFLCMYFCLFQQLVKSSVKEVVTAWIHIGQNPTHLPSLLPWKMVNGKMRLNTRCLQRMMPRPPAPGIPPQHPPAAMHAMAIHQLHHARRSLRMNPNPLYVEKKVHWPKLLWLLSHPLLK